MISTSRDRLRTKSKPAPSVVTRIIRKVRFGIFAVCDTKCGWRCKTCLRYRLVNGWGAGSFPTLVLKTILALQYARQSRCCNHIAFSPLKCSEPERHAKNPRPSLWSPSNLDTFVCACTPYFAVDLQYPVILKVLSHLHPAVARTHYSSSRKSSSSSTPSSSMKPSSSAVIFSPGARPARDFGWLTLGMAG